jgi:hypothetical protein
MTEIMSRNVVSEHYKLDQRVEDLLGKLLAGTMTASDRALYNNLNAQRSGLMRVKIQHKLRK